MAIKTIGVVGSGTMGTGIAHMAAMSGFQVLLHDVELVRVEKSIQTMDGLMQRKVSKNELSDEERRATLARITPTVNLDDFAQADLVVEAIFEELQAKKAVFSALDKICRPEVVLASNTSSMSITEIANTTGRPAGVCGMHFFNPAQLMKLVEVVRGYGTSDETVKTARTVAEQMGKITIEVKKDVPGFVVNRILMPLMVEAVRVLEEGIASIEDIDTGVKYGLNHPMGPFTLMDLTGNDINYNVMQYFYDELKKDQYAPPVTLKNIVRAGRLGRKTGKGWYDYKK